MRRAECYGQGERELLGLQPRGDRGAMLVVNTKETFLLNLHQNRVHFPGERNAQGGTRSQTSKRSRGKIFKMASVLDQTLKYQVSKLQSFIHDTHLM